MRRAIPYPCNSPIASSVCRTIRSSVPCNKSSFEPPILSSPRPLLWHHHRSLYAPQDRLVPEARNFLCQFVPALKPFVTAPRFQLLPSGFQLPAPSSELRAPRGLRPVPCPSAPQRLPLLPHSPHLLHLRDIRLRHRNLASRLPHIHGHIPDLLRRRLRLAQQSLHIAAHRNYENVHCVALAVLRPMDR